MGAFTGTVVSPVNVWIAMSFQAETTEASADLCSSL